MQRDLLSFPFLTLAIMVVPYFSIIKVRHSPLIGHFVLSQGSNVNSQLRTSTGSVLVLCCFWSGGGNKMKCRRVCRISAQKQVFGDVNEQKL